MIRRNKTALTQTMSWELIGSKIEHPAGERVRVENKLKVETAIQRLCGPRNIVTQATQQELALEAEVGRGSLVACLAELIFEKRVVKTGSGQGTGCYYKLGPCSNLLLVNKDDPFGR